MTSKKEEDDPIPEWVIKAFSDHVERMHIEWGKERLEGRRKLRNKLKKLRSKNDGS